MSRTTAVPVLLALALAVPAVGQDGAGTEAALVLQLDPAPRAVALGGALGPVTAGPLALHHGPAGLAGADRAVEVAYQTLPTDAAAGLAAATLPLGPGTLAAGLAFVDYGEVEELVPDGLGLVGVPTGGVVTGGEVALSLGYGLRAGPVVLGAVARSLRVELAGLDATATALDVGLGVEALAGRVTVRTALQNLGSDVDAGRSAPLPTVLRAGAALRFGDGDRRGLVTVEARAPRVQVGGSRPVTVAGGVEMGVRVAGVWVTGRVGYRQNEAAGDASSGFAAGGGIRLGGLRFDYAYRPLGPLGATQHLGLAYAPDRR